MDEQKITTEQPDKDSVQGRLWMAQLFGRNPELAARFAYYLKRLRRLSRAGRRRLARTAAVSLAGAALLLAMGGQPAHAFNIPVANGEVRILEDNICSLSEAIANAVDTSSGQPYDDCVGGNPSGPDTVVLPNGGNFVLTSPFDADYSYYGYAGLPDITATIIIEGNGSTIRRQAAAEFRILNVLESGDLTINNATLQGGDAYYYYGGAIFSYGNVTINDSTLTGNSAYTGGAIYSYNGDITISNSELTNNKAYAGSAVGMFYGTLSVSGSTVSGNIGNEGNGGGGFYIVGVDAAISDTEISGNFNDLSGGGILAESGTLTLNRVDLSDNSAGDYGYGGGLFLNDATVTINNSTISGNKAPTGGGINATLSDITIRNSVMEGNEAELTVTSDDLDPDGGAIYAYRGDLIIETTTISGNTAEGSGGGILSYNADLNISQSLLAGNEALRGGGLHNKGDAVVSNSTFSGNTAGNGGAIANEGQVAVFNLTVTGNAADPGSGGGFNNLEGGTMRVVRSLVSGNSADVAGPQIQNGGAINVDDFNVFGQDLASGLSGVSAGPSDIVPAAGLSAVLDPVLANNGGPTESHSLAENSPALDAAPSNACSAPPVNGVDQRGVGRNADADEKNSDFECDIGSLEEGGGQRILLPAVLGS